MDEKEIDALFEEFSNFYSDYTKAIIRLPDEKEIVAYLYKCAKNSKYQVCLRENEKYLIIPMRVLNDIRYGDSYFNTLLCLYDYMFIDINDNEEYNLFAFYKKS